MVIKSGCSVELQQVVLLARSILHLEIFVCLSNENTRRFHKPHFYKQHLAVSGFLNGYLEKKKKKKKNPREISRRYVDRPYLLR